ncbi:MAG: Alcohol dehydrogenase zinc-binding domain protein [Thermoleophilia bacterium]|nr:Alcohol dehydrogenase zinc-binding domain protein [Thermoleophilia bacterium]
MTMHAAVLDSIGSTPRYDSAVPVPTAGPGQVRVKVELAGLNPIDLTMAAGTFPGPLPAAPNVVGREGIGTTDDGRRVYFAGTVAPHGSLAEYTIVEDGPNLIQVTDDLDARHAVAFGIAGMAGWISTVWRGAVTPDDVVLVLGASGVVGQVAVQAARIAGARQVIAAARSEAGLTRALELGADTAVRLADDLDHDGLVAAFRDAVVVGDVTLVIDPLWGAPAAAAIEALGPNGRLVQLGQSAGAELTLRSGWVRQTNTEIRGYTNKLTPREVVVAEYGAMLEAADAGDLELEVEELALADIGLAWERQESSPGVKLVIRP